MSGGTAPVQITAPALRILCILAQAINRHYGLTALTHSINRLYLLLCQRLPLLRVLLDIVPRR
jgi:hypothetical protein